MREALGPSGVEQKPPIAQRVLLQNALLAHGIAFVVNGVLGSDLNTDGRRLLRSYARRAWRGERVSVAKEISQLLNYSEPSVEVTGEQNIPTVGPTVFAANHISAGPLRHLGQFFRMVQVGYDARSGVLNDEAREPYLIVQNGLAWHAIGKLSRVFYGIVGEKALRCEIVEIARYKKSENESGEQIVNHQGLKESAIKRIVAGGASVWMPQGRERAPDDFVFPKKGNGYLGRISDQEPYAQVVPVCSIPDSHGNLKIVFGRPVDIKDVIANGGIEDFGLRHVAPLRQSGL